MLSRSQLQELYPRAEKPHLHRFVAAQEELFTKFGIGANPQRLQFFLAQIGHESGGLTITVENLNYSAARICQVWPSRFRTIEAARPFAHNPEALANLVYCDRMGNGPRKSGDGWAYRGRGYIQITGRDGYRSVGKIAGLSLEDKPDQAATPENALAVACAFWEWKRLNALCDTGDFVAVTRRINGGITGINDRLAWLDKVRRVSLDQTELTDQPAAEQVVEVQRALQELGYSELGAADGIVGKRTAAAIARFRREVGLQPGLIDETLLRQLNLSDQGQGKRKKRTGG